jgi:uncharacterized protein YdhG (YjbR/CyaY superfamily)
LPLIIAPFAIGHAYSGGAADFFNPRLRRIADGRDCRSPWVIFRGAHAMQYDVATPREYLDVLAPDWRRDTLMQLRQAIRRAAPDWQETVHYKMLAYGPPGAPLLHLNAQKHFVGLYVGDVATLDPDGSLLGDVAHGKGCVRFKRKNPVTGPRIDRLLARYVALKRGGIGSDC